MSLAEHLLLFGLATIGVALGALLTFLAIDWLTWLLTRGSRR